MRAWPMKTHRQHPASQPAGLSIPPVRSRDTPSGTGQLSRARRLLATPGGLPAAGLQRAATLNPHTGISVYITLTRRHT
jgi:hypothetical protein